MMNFGDFLRIFVDLNFVRRSSRFKIYVLNCEGHCGLQRAPESVLTTDLKFATIFVWTVLACL